MMRLVEGDTSFTLRAVRAVLTRCSVVMAIMTELFTMAFESEVYTLDTC